MWILVDPTQKVLTSATLSNEIFCCPFMFINLVVHFFFFSLKTEHKQRCCYSLHYNSITSSYCNYPQVARWCAGYRKIFVLMQLKKVKWISFYNHRNRGAVGGRHNVLLLYVDVSAHNPPGAVLCIPFIWDILLFIPNQNLAQQRNEFQNIPISSIWCLLHWNTNQPSPYYFC